MAKRATDTPKQKLSIGHAELKLGAKRPAPPEPAAPISKIQRAKARAQSKSKKR